MSKTRRRFSREFKREAIWLSELGDKGVSQANWATLKIESPSIICP